MTNHAQNRSTWPNCILPAHYVRLYASRPPLPDRIAISSLIAGFIPMQSTANDDAIEPETSNITQSDVISIIHAPPCDPVMNGRKSTPITLDNLQFIQRLGSGDIGSVYLVEVKDSNGCLFAAKIMDKKELVSRDKEIRARIEREILESLDHPFLPSLYASLDSPQWSCLLTEFCPGGDLHVLRQQQPDKRFDESSVRFYASEVIVALEYLHMMGIIYRDLKPENILVRSDGHIMLTDFDLSLKDDNSKSMAQIVLDDNSSIIKSSKKYPIEPPLFPNSPCILPYCMGPMTTSCFKSKRKRRKQLPRRGNFEIVTEPIELRSMSFVGTYEYLAPEVLSGEGHGNAVDWWTLGIFVYEMLYGVTPFKGVDHELTLANIVARAIEFPKEPIVSQAAKDLMTQLLNKNSRKRMGSVMGATAMKQHRFFDGVNWALLRCTKPPFVPPKMSYKDFVARDNSPDNTVEYY